MPSAIGVNHAKRKLAAGELVLCMGVNQMRTPNIAMIAGACGFDAIYIDLEHNPTSGSNVGYILNAGRAEGRRLREVKLP
jgi:2-keto-3-deoxy-L-rhamnonate aldolase RhmA